MIPGYKDDLAQPIERATLPTRCPAYVQNIGQDKTHITGEVDALEAYRQAVFHILFTPRHQYGMNLPNEGSEIHLCIGRDYSFFYSRIDNMVKDALYQDDRTLEVIIKGKGRDGLHSVFVDVEARSTEGTITDRFIIPLEQGGQFRRA